MLEYEFERIAAGAEGYSLFGGVGFEMEAAREVILRRAAEGWRYAGRLPARQRAPGHVEEMDLVFERGHADE